MSIYDSSRTGASESESTRIAKVILSKTIYENFKKKGFKVTVKEEVPALFPTKPYTLDLGVLIRSIEQFDQYHFFGIEIDSKVGHRTFLKDNREEEREAAFLNHSGLQIIRFNIEQIVGKNKQSPLQLFNDIWDIILKAYLITPLESKLERQAEKNKQFAIQLKENAYTKCKLCDHPPHLHTLVGCHFTQTNKNKLRCNCYSPFFISNA